MTNREAARLWIRAASPLDLAAIEEIDRQSPEGAHWPAVEYLKHQCWVATSDGAVAGYAVCRSTAPDEREILALAVHPDLRRRGIGKALLRKIVQNWTGTVHLEVRGKNSIALRFYEEYGFRESGYRKQYYPDTGEDAIVLSFQPC